MILKRFQLIEGKLVHFRLFRVEPLFRAHKELIVPGQAQVYAVCFHAYQFSFLPAAGILP